MYVDMSTIQPEPLVQLKCFPSIYLLVLPFIYFALSLLAFFCRLYRRQLLYCCPPRIAPLIVGNRDLNFGQLNNLLLLLMNCSIRKATAATINSQVCSGRKEMACPAVLKMRVTIELMSPGKLDAVFLPISFRPIPMPLPSVFWAFVIAPMTAPMTVPTPRTVAVTVMPYFLSTSMMRSRSESPSSKRSFSLTSRSRCCIFPQLFHELFNG